VTIRIGTSERDGTFHSQGRALATILDQHAQLGTIAVLESQSASVDNARCLHAGEIELGFMASNWIGRAKNGEAPFERPIDLAMAAPMNAGPLFFVVRAEGPIRSFSRSARTADCGRPAHERHGATRPRPVRRAGHEVFRFLADLP
jgi:TRAP-type uncharacterized transport system substrate-binding protein